MRLRFDGDATPFAAVYGAEQVTLELPNDTALGAWLSMHFRWPDTSGCFGGCLDNEAEIAAVVGAEDVPLFAKSPTVVAGFAVPYAQTALRWRSSPPNLPAVNVELALSDVASEEWLEWQASCETLSLVPGEFLAAEVLGYIDDGTILSAETEVTLHRKPGDPPVAIVKGGIAGARVLQRTDTHVRIWWEAAEAVLFGWVAADSLKPPGPGGRSHFGRPPRLRKPPTPRGREVMCQSPLHLVAHADETFFTVGRIVRSAHAIYVHPQSENYSALELWSWDKPLDVSSSSLLINRAELRDACRQ